MLSCTRSTTGTYIDSNGLITTIPANTLRYGDRGLLVEEARTSLLTRSEELDHADWVKGDATMSSEVAAFPDGNETMDKIVETIANQPHRVYQALSITADVTYTASCFFKPGGRDYVSLHFADFGNSQAFVVATFDVAAGTVTKTDAGISGTYIDSDIELFDGGVYRAWVTGSLALVAIPSLVVSTNSSGTPTYGNFGYEYYVGDITKGIIAGGAGLEQGASVTSYIPTVGSSVLRAADVCNLGLDNGDYDITATFEDDSSQDFLSQTVTGGGGWDFPAALDNKMIKTLVGYTA